jgi:alkylated DNA repair dioxygenase AlkB
MSDLPFTLFPAAFTDVELEALKGLAWEQKQLTMYGKTFDLPRLTTMYGSAYRYSGVHHPARAMPQVLAGLRARVEEITGVAGFDSVLGNLYRGGQDSVGWHSDDDYNAVKPHVASLSFGATRRFRLRSKADKSITHTMELEHGSLLLMGERCQLDWMHCVPRTSKKVGERINLTFRCMS